MQEFSLGEISASPEFSFPLQLIYLTTREQSGLFGPQWFCPQLESSVIPKQENAFVWTTPGGSVVPFIADPRKRSEFRSPNGEWRARIAGSRQTIRDESGWEFAYSRGKLESITSPTGRVLEYVRQGGELKELLLRDSKSGAKQLLARFSMDKGGRRLAVLGFPSRQVEFAYAKTESETRLAGWKASLGYPVQFRYDPRSGVLSAMVQSGKPKPEVTEFQVEYVPSEDKKEETAERRKKPAAYRLIADGEFQYVYPQSDSISAVRRKDGSRLAEGAFKGHRGVIEVKTPSANQRSVYYRAPGQRYDGKLRRIEKDDRILVEYRYDRRSGALKEMIDQNGQITFFDYADEELRSRWEPKPRRIRRGTRKVNSVIAEYQYDKAGKVTAEKDADGNVTRYGYTPRGELESILKPDGRETKYAYDALGRIVSVTQNGLSEKVEYDSQGRVAARIAPDGVRTEFAYDEHGLVASVRADGKLQVEYRRDELGRIEEKIDPLGRGNRVEYDGDGNVIAEIQPNGTVTRYEYDERNRRTAQIDGNGNRIEFGYDEAGRLISQRNPLGGFLAWSYDSKGRLVERANGEQTIAYKYDEEDRLAQIDYQAAPGAGLAASSTRSGADYFGTSSRPSGRMAAAPPSGGVPTRQTIDYTYDDEGRILKAATPETAVEYVRDPKGRVEAQRFIGQDGEQLLRFRYDSAGRRTGLILAELVPAQPAAGGRAGTEARYEVLQQTEYTYDNTGRLSAIIDNGVPAVRYTYDGSGRLAAKEFGNGIKVTISHDALGRLERTEFSGGPLKEPEALEYTWDEASQVARRSWNGQTQRYTYDPSGQLLEVVDADSGETLEKYAYDKAGNMLEKLANGETVRMTYNAANQLANFTNSQAETREYAYDKAGRMLGYEGGAQSRYGWLDKVTDLELPGGTSVAYTYWPDGQLAAKQIESHAKSAEEAGDSNGGLQQIANRESKIENKTAERFLWDGLALLRRNGTVYLIEPHPSGGVPIASHPVGASGPVTWYLNDMLGTTLAAVQGGETQFVKLTSFGQPMKSTTNPQSPSVTQPASVPTGLPTTESLQSVQ